MVVLDNGEKYSDHWVMFVECTHEQLARIEAACFPHVFDTWTVIAVAEVLEWRSQGPLASFEDAMRYLPWKCPASNQTQRCLDSICACCTPCHERPEVLP